MSAEAVEPLGPGTFNDASPREVRAALVPEDQPNFDRQWRNALAEAADTLDLAEVFRVLDSWRSRAMITKHLGHNGYRQMLARAEQTLCTGEPPPGSMPWSQLKVELGL